VDRKVKSFRLRTDLLAWIESYAKERGSTQIAVLEAAIGSFKDMAGGGVPDLPEEEPAVVPARVMHQQPPQPDLAKAEQEMRAAVWARQARLNEGKDRASGSQR
jgi:hypothetical protein